MPIDRRKLESIAPRLQQAANIWLATVRPNGQPHLIPIWFIWDGDKIWICTPRDSRKIANLKENPRVSLALEDGNHPVMLEGTATDVLDRPFSGDVPAAFLSKYKWNIHTDDDAEYVLVGIRPIKLMLGRDSEGG